MLMDLDFWDTFYNYNNIRIYFTTNFNIFLTEALYSFKINPMKSKFFM